MDNFLEKVDVVEVRDWLNSNGHDVLAQCLEDVLRQPDGSWGKFTKDLFEMLSPCQCPLLKPDGKIHLTIFDWVGVRDALHTRFTSEQYPRTLYEIVMKQIDNTKPIPEFVVKVLKLKCPWLMFDTSSAGAVTSNTSTEKKAGVEVLVQSPEVDGSSSSDSETQIGSDSVSMSSFSSSTDTDNNDTENESGASFADAKKSILAISDISSRGREKHEKDQVFALPQ